ncbi:UdgX family uracil-DNA binding protein [Thermaurantiacus sp.]
MRRAVLAHAADLEGFRQALRALVAEGVSPCEVLWEVAGAEGLALAEPVQASAAAPLAVPRRYAELAEKVVCHSDPARFALLHEALLRLRQVRTLLDDRADPLTDRLLALEKAVGRDLHKMRAFVRFRELHDEAGPHFVAWFEPEHHILRANCGFFIRRFANQRWTILTPEASAHWDGAALHILPGAAKVEAPAGDPLEAMWSSYYRAIFNPARLKPAAMASEMPRKYWHNLPEAAAIPELVATAAARTAAMRDASDGSAFGGKAAAAGRAGASARPTLAALAQAASACTRCPLHGPATQTVFGEGPADARLMLVGEQPGDQEDLQGRPFVGPAGQLLDECLAEAGIDRHRTYVTNAVKHFRFEQRGRRRIHQSPEASHIEACRWWLDQELALVRPALVVMLGASAGRALLGRPVTVGRERGRPLLLPGGSTGFLTVHPSYLLRIANPDAAAAERARFVADLSAAYALAA